MKHILFFLFSVLLLRNAQSQDSTLTLSQFELFTSQPNKLLKTEIREIGNVGWTNINLFKTTDLLSGSSAYAIRAGNYNNGYMPALIAPSALYIDLGTLDTVIAVLDQIMSEADKPKSASDVQFTYTTSNDIVFTGSFDRASNYWNYEIGKVYKNLRTYVPGTTLTLTKKRFTELVSVLKKARDLQW